MLHKRPLSFDTAQKQRIDDCLLWLADNIGSPLVMIADISGRLVLYRGRLPAAQSTGLAALAAGSFAANTEIGHFLGLKTGFQQQLLEGELANLYILAVGSELLMIIAFTRQIMLGMVRLFAYQTQQKLLEIVQEATLSRETAPGTEPLEDSFGVELSRQLDELFSREVME